MKLIVGLGNPGKKYENNRHNIGFIIIDTLRKELNAPEFKLNKKFNAEISEISYSRVRLGFKTQSNANAAEQKIILVKPQTFMNESGKAVKLLKNFYKIPIKNILIIRDDLDMAFGKYREKINSSSGGHNGINSIIENLGSQNFTQIKIGVRNNDIEKIDAADFVLQNFNSEEKEQLKKILLQLTQNIITSLLR